MSLGEMSQPSGSAQPLEAHLYLVTYRNGQPLYPDALTQQQTAMHPVFRHARPQASSLYHHTCTAKNHSTSRCTF